MKRKAILALVILIVFTILLVTVVIPAVDGEMMKAPVVSAITAVRNGDPNALEACFTPDATITVNGMPTVKFSWALSLSKPMFEHDQWQGGARLGSFRRTRSRSKRLVEADVTVLIWFETGDLPYRNVPPVKKQAHLVLEKQHLFSWKIKELVSDEEEIRFFINRDAGD